MAKGSLDLSERQSVKASVAPPDTDLYLSRSPDQLVGQGTWRATPTPAHLRDGSPCLWSFPSGRGGTHDERPVNILLIAVKADTQHSL